MSDEIETIDKNPKSWAAWKREAERLQAIIDDMALAAMDSEPVEMPLDYLQGHKDGLEWAARLAEANHPCTGDWLYDDPIELAKAIRKGPDMPPVQPVADSEPDRNPVLAYADSYRDMAKQGVESVPIWSVITDLERNIAPLYRHAQPAPVVPDEIHARKAFEAWYKTKYAFHGYEFEITDSGTYLWDNVNHMWNGYRAAMLQELKKSAGVTKMCRSNENVQVLHANSPETPDGWTGNDKANAALMMLDRIETADPVDDDRIDGIKRIVREFAATTQLPGSDPATVPGKWIKCSERMPEAIGEYLVAYKLMNHWIYQKVITFAHLSEYTNEMGWNSNLEITHWMPLPAGPQEVR